MVEADAAKLRDDTRLQRVAAVSASTCHWHVTVRDGAFNAAYVAPTAGPPP